MRDWLRQLPTWQIYAGAVGALLVFLIGGYFLVTALTTTPPATEAKSNVPANLDSESNRKVVKQLDSFTAPTNLPILTEPLETPDPNAPSTVNPFNR